MDEIIIQNILRGNTEEFRHLITKYKDIAYSIAISVIKDEFYAEEIIQVAFLKAFEKLDTFKGGSKFSTWLCKIVINESFRLIKKNKIGLIYYAETPVELTQKPEYTLKLEEADQKRCINEGLKILAPKESLILRLFYLEECSIEEISNMTGWTNSNIKVILHRGRINLKVQLTEYFKFKKNELY